jgi:hypothetical protein
VALVWPEDSRLATQTLSHNNRINNTSSCPTEVNSNVPEVYRVMERVLGGTTAFHTKCPPISSTTLPLEVRIYDGRQYVHPPPPPFGTVIFFSSLSSGGGEEEDDVCLIDDISRARKQLMGTLLVFYTI